MISQSSGEWKSKQVTRDETNTLTSFLVDAYLEDRLIRSGLQLKRRRYLDHGPTRYFNSNKTTLRSKSWLESLGFFQARSEKQDRILELAGILIAVQEMLETKHSGLYTDILSKLNIYNITEVNLRKTFLAVARKLFADGVRWSRVLALFAFSGGLTVDCVSHGFNQYSMCIKDWLKEFMTTDVSAWIQTQGGWDNFAETCTNKRTQQVVTSAVVLTRMMVTLLVPVVILVALLIRAQ